MNHVETVHKPPGFPGYKCKTCSFISPTRIIFQNHMSVQHSEERQLVSRNPGELKTNVYRIGNLWQCNLCDYNNARRDCCLNHIESQHTHPSDFGYQCDDCEYIGKSKNAFRAHMGRHQERKAAINRSSNPSEKAKFEDSVSTPLNHRSETFNMMDMEEKFPIPVYNNFEGSNENATLASYTLVDTDPVSSEHVRPTKVLWIK